MLRIAGFVERKKTEKCTLTNMVTEDSPVLPTLKSNANQYGTYLIANLLHRYFYVAILLLSFAVMLLCIFQLVGPYVHCCHRHCWHCMEQSSV